MAVGGRSYSTSVQEAGCARMFEYNGSSWVQLGDKLFGTELGEQMGSAVKLTRDVNSVAIGSPETLSTSTGKTRMFDWNGSNWVQRGNAILGSLTSKSGLSIDLSFDGNIIAVGEPWANSFNGTVKLHEWNGSSWQQLGTTLSPSNSSAIVSFGSALRLNSNGSRVIIGEPSNDEAGFNTGQITVFGDGSDAGPAELTEVEIHLFPNPSSDFISISSEENIESVLILDMTGREILNIKANSNNVELDVKAKANGKYAVRVITQNGIRVIPFIKND
ncbi:MAG: T9SS type A sorting domain-containing protein [Crocinitomicaceae bacterium]|nr:T9SS type A sorting domain-containing protein [Crocinitomicaceae bacterium]